MNFHIFISLLLDTNKYNLFSCVTESARSLYKIKSNSCDQCRSPCMLGRKCLTAKDDRKHFRVRVSNQFTSFEKEHKVNLLKQTVGVMCTHKDSWNIDYPAPVIPINSTLCCVLILRGYPPLWSASETLTRSVSRRILGHKDVCSGAEAKCVQKMLVMVTFHSYAYIKRTIHNKHRPSYK